MSPQPLLANLLLAIVATSAMAQEVRVYGAGEAVDPHEVATILEGARPAMKMRSIRLLDESPVQAAAPQAGGAVTEEHPANTLASALALPVQFAFDSSEILPAARQQLDALADGIRLLSANAKVVIEGHTDAVGSDPYNEQLSARRALAVKRYLASAHGIDTARMRAVGLGKHEPLPGHDPLAPENRRVQFRGE